MTVRRAVGGLRTAALLCVVLVVNLLATSGPARATTDIAPTATILTSVFGGCNTYGSGHAGTASNDVNDSTYAQGNGACADMVIGYDLGTAVEIASARLLNVAGSDSGWCSVGTWSVRYSDDGFAGAGTEALFVGASASSAYGYTHCVSANTSGSYDSGTVSFTAATHRYWELRCAGSQVACRVGTFQLFDTGPVSVSIDEYIANARVDHPSFQWSASFQWRQDWHGSLTVATSSSAGTYYTADSGGTAITTSHVYTSYAAHAGNSYLPYFHQDCFPLCQSDEFTIVIDDTDRNQTATYTFLRSASGAVGPVATVPRFVYVIPCFNHTANQCPSGTSAANTLDLAWKWVGTDSRLDVGPIRPDATYAEVPFYDPNESAGAYTELAIPVNTSLPTLWRARLTNGAGNQTDVTFRLDFTTGGTGDTFTSTDPRDNPPATCAQADVPVVGGILCGLQAIWAVSAQALQDKIADTIGDCDDQGANCTGLIGTVMSRQPFNFIARSLTGVGSQIARLTEATTATDDCPGFEVSLPWALWVPSAYRPTADPLTFYLLRCSDFEPFVSTTWYQALRTAMDPALFLAYGYMWVKRLQPRPVAAG